MNKNKDQLGFNFDDPTIIESVEEKKERAREEKKAQMKLDQDRNALKSKLEKLSKFDFKKLDDKDEEEVNEVPELNEEDLLEEEEDNGE